MLQVDPADRQRPARGRSRWTSATTSIGWSRWYSWTPKVFGRRSTAGPRAWFPPGRTGPSPPGRQKAPCCQTSGSQGHDSAGRGLPVAGFRPRRRPESSPAPSGSRRRTTACCWHAHPSARRRPQQDRGPGRRPAGSASSTCPSIARLTAARADRSVAGRVPPAADHRPARPAVGRATARWSSGGRWRWPAAQRNRRPSSAGSGTV